jgi:hypothetical protein
MVCGLIGEAVVMAVKPNPFDRSALASERAHNHQHAFQPNRNHKAAVRYQTVQSEGDPQNGHPIQNTEGNNRLPAPKLREQGHGGQDVIHQHEAGGSCF